MDQVVSKWYRLCYSAELNELTVYVQYILVWNNIVGVVTSVNRLSQNSNLNFGRSGPVLGPLRVQELSDSLVRGFQLHSSCFISLFTLHDKESGVINTSKEFLEY